MNWLYTLFVSMFNLNRTTGVVLAQDSNKKTEHKKSEDRDLDKKRKRAIYSIYNYILTFKDLLQFDAEKSSRKLDYYSDMYDCETRAWIVFKIENDPIIKELSMFVADNSIGNGFKSKRTGRYYNIFLNGHLISRDWFFDHKTYEHYQVFTDDMIEDIIKIFAERYKKLDDKYYSNEIHNFAF